MTEVALETLSESLRGFYVPQFEVTIEGAGLQDDILRDVVEVTYKDSLDELDSCTLKVNNWDEQNKKFKYIGSETVEEMQAGGDAAARYTLFEPCKKEVKLKMGYVGNLTLMMTGTFTTMEPSFSDSAAPSLSVKALNILHQLRRKKISDAFENKKESQIAEEISNRPVSRRNTERRFPLRICVNNAAKREENTTDLVAQKNEYDIDFLWKLARKKGYILVVREEIEREGTQIQPRHLYFGPSGGVSNCNTDTDPNAQDAEFEQPVTYDLAWGKSLISFNPRLTTANQFRSVTVNGWNRRRQRAINETIDFTDRELQRLNCDLHDMVINCDPREELVVDEPVFTPQQAKRRARALLLDQHKQIVTVSGTTIGLPEMRAGSSVKISNVGSRLSGIYLLTKTEHTINDSGYITKFEGRREHIPEDTTPCVNQQQA